MSTESATESKTQQTGARYGYGDGLQSSFGSPPAIDDAYSVIVVITSIPATIISGVFNFFKKVTS
jgi:hypothetical protein